MTTTTEDFDEAKVLARVQKMMALANDKAASEGERDNALRMAHNTLAKYNLQMAYSDLAKKPTGEKRTDGTLTLREYAWMRDVGYAVSMLFFTKFFLTPQPKKHAIYVFVGRHSNVYTSLKMCKYLIDSINKEASRQAVAAGETPKGNYWRSFCKGAVAKLVVRCVEIRRNAEAVKNTAPSTGTSLTLASVYAAEMRANDDYLANEMGLKLKDGKRRERPPGRGFNEGVRYADDIGLNQQLPER